MLGTVAECQVNFDHSQFLAQSRFQIARFSSTSEGFASDSGITQHDDQPIDIPNPFKKEKVECILCKHKIQPNYKNVKLLSQFQSPYTGRIYGRHITGLCKRMQARVESEIVKAQNMALMGYYTKDVSFLKDPRLFDPERPLRPHKY